MNQIDPNQTYFLVPAAVLKVALDLLNSMPRGQSNPVATALEQLPPIQGAELQAMIDARGAQPAKGNGADPDPIAPSDG